MRIEYQPPQCSSEVTYRVIRDGAETWRDETTGVTMSYTALGDYLQRELSGRFTLPLLGNDVAVIEVTCTPATAEVSHTQEHQVQIGTRRVWVPAWDEALKCDSTFKDVNSGTPFSTEIRSLADRCVIEGYPDNTFHGEWHLNRQDFAAFMYRLERTHGEPEFDASSVNNPFKDVTKDTPHYTEILWAYNEGLITGFGEGENRKFRGGDSLLRQDAAAMLHRLAGSPSYTPSQSSLNRFKDVNASTPYYQEILWGADHGIINGFDDNTFRGGDLIIRQDTAAFLFRVDGVL